MLAIGITLVVVGFLISRIFGTNHPLIHNNADMIAGICLLVGIGFSMASLFVYLWKNFL